MDLDERIKRATAETKQIKESIDKGLIPDELLKMKERNKWTEDQFHEFLKFSYKLGDGSIKTTTEKNATTGETVVTLDFSGFEK